jgi:hypothetical protein
MFKKIHKKYKQGGEELPYGWEKNINIHLLIFTTL